MRRNLVLLAAAVGLALSGIGISVAALSTHTEDPSTHLHRVAGISDPVARLNALYDVYQSTARANPRAVAVGTRMNTELKQAIAKTSEELKDDPEKQTLVDEAQTWVDDLTSGDPLTPPSPAPSPPSSPSPAPSPSAPPPPSGAGVPTPSGSGILPG
jgi:hypothetical protein